MPRGLMRLIWLRRVLPKRARNALRDPWARLLSSEHNLRERGFYRQFIQPKDLVFDVGANIGVKTRAFLSLGARVIAVEPNPTCVESIRSDHRHALASGQLHVEPLAVASRNGEVALTRYSESAVTSGSAEFIRYLQDHDWATLDTVVVQSVTLDDLIARFGVPGFIKIDVEGMDAEVLRGLSRRPRYLSFEYHTDPLLWQNTVDCFREVQRLGFTEANLTREAVPKFVLPEWVETDAALFRFDRLRTAGEQWGDVIVR